MKTDHHYLRLINELALLVAVCILFLAPQTLLFGAETAPKKDRIFEEIPGLTTRPLAPAVTNTPGATPAISSQAQPPLPNPGAPAPPGRNPVTNAPPELPGFAADKTLYSFQATDLDLKSALAAFARANNLNIVPDNDITGTVTLDV